MHKNQYFSQILLLLLVLILSAIYWLFGVSASQQMWFFLGATLSIGMFHGMLDIVLLQQKISQMAFLTSGLFYAVVVVLCAALLLALPVLTVPILLLISVWHFGEAQGQQTGKTCPIVRTVLGGAPIAMPYLAAQPAILQLLQSLQLSANATQIAMQVWQFIAYFWLAVLVAVLLAGVFKVRRWLGKTHIAELVTVALAFALLPPLLAFSAYFAGYHALRHIADVFRTQSNLKKQFKFIVLIALASACLLAWLAVSLSGKVNWANFFASQTLFHATLIMLVAVTLPHAFLVSVWRNRLSHKN